MSPNFNDNQSKLSEMRKQREIARMREKLDKYQKNIKKRNRLNIVLILIFAVLLGSLGFLGVQWIRTNNAQMQLEELLDEHDGDVVETFSESMTETESELS